MQNKKAKTLKPLRVNPRDYDSLEKALKDFFKKEIYIPILKELGVERPKFKNAKDDLIEAIRSGRIVYSKGQFKGNYSATLTRELRRLGAEWDRKQGTWKIPLSKIPPEIRAEISLSVARFEEKIKKIDEKLKQFSSEKIADKLQIKDVFDASIYKFEKEFRDNVKSITIEAKLTEEQVKRISDEYTNNMRFYIQDFAEKEISKLREEIQDRVFKGLRYEGAVKAIQDSYGVSANKAKFLARQETNILMTKYQQLRYEDAGVDKYIWRCVKMPHQGKGQKYQEGMVRHEHGILDGKIFSWQNPPIVNDRGERKHPGEDYNCRCIAIPYVEF